MESQLVQLLQVLISGITLGSVYGVSALGLSLVFGTSKVFNFTYGSFFTWGAYIAWILAVGYANFSYTLVFLLVIPILFLVGMLFERIIIRPLRWRSGWQITTMIVTLGMAILLDNLALEVFGPLVKSIPPLFEGSFMIGVFALQYHSIAILFIAISSMIFVEIFLNNNMEGAAMRAVSQDMIGAQMVGIPVNLSFGYAFGISTVMAGLSGILLAPIYLISPFGGWNPFVKAFVVVILGGLGSTKGTLYAAFLLGIFEALVSWQFGAVWSMPFWFIILVIILLIRPQGLFGKWA